MCIFIFRYLTCTEWSTLYGGKRPGIEKPKFARLPYDHCCLTLVPFKTPFCDPDGNVFEYEALLEYIKQFKHNPVTGKVNIINISLILYIYQGFVNI
jgi:peptidyl-prolyl cis-trans isomerase-like protein 2